ncbi:MAG: ABC transporter ATP-binding protein [Gallionella sp.]|jgi:spermidine/putrescine transport system ATP-binding protein|nr:ABC transporter ATP-binding protein [Gallionella sp.]MCK9354217.1 ABC transporter ATP-binding protein [Gallionella sp.]
MARLELKNVTRRFGDFVAVDDVSLTIESGEFFTLLGPSGCGKTTILRMIAGFDLPDAGQILLDGQDLVDIPAEKRPIHTVFQSYALFPHLTVADNVAFPLKMAHRSREEIRSMMQEALERVRLAGKADAYPHELSGGEKQRVALARGLVNRPRLLLLDESLAALDAKLREEMQVELINLQRDVGITFVFVTHAQVEALALSHRIAVMNLGRVEQVDEPSRLYGFPRNRFVADFIGNINMIAAQVVESVHGHLRLTAAGLGEIVAPTLNGVTSGDKGVYAIRPEQVRIGMHGELTELKNHFEGTVHSLLYQGDVSVYRVRLANGATIEALLPNSAPGRAELFEAGDAVKVGWRHDAGMFLR